MNVIYNIIKHLKAFTETFNEYSPENEYFRKRNLGIIIALLEEIRSCALDIHDK